MRFTHLWQRQLGIAALVLLGWCLVILGFSAQLVAVAGFTWERAIRVNLREWLPWVLLAPLVFGMARRFPLEKGNLSLAVPSYVATAFVSVFVAGIMFHWLSSVPGLAPDGEDLDGPPSIPQRGPQEGEPSPRGRERPTGGRGPRFGQPPGQRPPPGAPGFRRGLFPRGGTILRARFNIPVCFVVMSMANAFAYYRRSQERDRKTRELSAHLAQAKLQALRLQLQPHFLFNALNAIATLVHKNPDVADDMIASLSDLLRATLETTDQEIPLRRELGILDRYLEIEQMRLGDRLKIERDVDDATLDVMVPTMLLQPLAENAVRHGIEPRLAPGILRIWARKEGVKLLLQIHDNGVGLRLSRGSVPREGVGLTNTRARLRELHGSQASVELQSPAEGGTMVCVELPVKTKP